MPGLSFLTAILLVAWIIILVWLSDRLLRVVASRTGWKLFDWRNWLLCFVILVAAIYLANAAIDWIDFIIGTRAEPEIGPPGAFLLGSVAIAVPIAGIRARRDG